MPEDCKTGAHWPLFLAREWALASLVALLVFHQPACHYHDDYHRLNRYFCDHALHRRYCDDLAPSVRSDYYHYHLNLCLVQLFELQIVAAYHQQALHPHALQRLPPGRQLTTHHDHANPGCVFSGN